MRDLNEAAICELVDLCIPDKLSDNYLIIGKENLRLYRNGEFAAIDSSSDSLGDKLRANIITSFKNENLLMTSETSLFETYF